MVNFICQLDWVTWYPDLELNITSGYVSESVSRGDYHDMRTELKCTFEVPLKLGLSRLLANGCEKKEKKIPCLVATASIYIPE